MSVVDDFGRYTAHPKLLRAALFPLQLEKIRETEMERLLLDCAEAGLLCYYEIDSKKYLELNDFRQQRRAETSKYPDPSHANAKQLIACAKRPVSNEHLGVCVCGDVCVCGGALMRKAHEVYAAYPRKKNRVSALKAIERALKKVPFQELLEKTKAYALSVAGKELKYVPYPQKWFNQECFTELPEGPTLKLRIQSDVTANDYKDRGDI